MIPTIDDLKVKADLFMEQNKEVNVHIWLRQAVIDYMAEFARQQLLNKHDVSGSFSSVAEHLCWANADFNDKCMICGRENCR